MKPDVQTLSIASIIAISIVGYAIYKYKPTKEKE